MNALATARKARKAHLDAERGALEPGGVDEPELSADAKLIRENEVLLKEALATR